MTTAAIHVDQVTAGYGAEPVLDNLTLSIAPGEMVGILGPNGAGKSTLFSVLSGLRRPFKGQVSLFGVDVHKLAPADRARAIGVVPQDMDIPVPYTVEEFVTMGRTASMGRFASPTALDRQSIERALVFTDVADIRHRPVNELSGGERQRSIVAMALAQDPRIILMDEATSHLDINHRLEIMQLVERLNREDGVTVLMISHDLQLAAEFSERLILLDHGNVIADGSPASVLTEDTLRQVYHCNVRVNTDAASGSISILAAPRLPAPGTGKGIRLHVIGGGGCGEAFFRRLALCGYTISSGVVNQGDQDSEVVQALGIETVFEKPFSPISAESLAAAMALANQADAFILSPVPFGTGNLANLKILDNALSARKPVFIAEGIERRDFTPTKDAIARMQSLLARGARPYRDMTDLLDALPRGS